MSADLREKVLAIISKVIDPEIGASLVEFGLIRPEWVKVDETKKQIEVSWVPTTPFCPLIVYISATILWVLKKEFPGWCIKVKLHPDVLGAEVWNKTLEDPEEMEKVISVMEKENSLRYFIKDEGG